MGGNADGRGVAGQRGIKGEKWDNCNSIINKIYLKKENFNQEIENIKLEIGNIKLEIENIKGTSQK